MPHIAGRTSNTLIVIRKVLDTCVNKPVVLVDGGPWYPWPLDRMGIRWLHVTLGYINAIERFFRTLKERTRRFYNNLTSDRLYNLQSFMDVLMLWYKHLRKHQGLGKIPMEVLSQRYPRTNVFVFDIVVELV
jgi:transposase-like protein